MDVLQFNACSLAFALYVIYMFSMTSFSNAVLSNETDRASLLEFKAALSAPSYQVLSSWNESTHFCKWKGITCGRRHQRVILLDLQGLGLEGSISPSIGNLSFLRGINLQSNKFHGSLPPQLARLLRLRHLNLSRNSFAGQIPTNLSHCSNLRVLKLDRNQLGGPIHAQLTILPSLLVMNLSFNQFNGTVPPSIGNLSTLKYLGLASNSLIGHIPYSLGRIKGLFYLALSGNFLSGIIPSSISNISSLEVIAVTENNLHGSLPADLGLAHPNLKVVYAAYNRFSGSIPVSLSNATGLQMFHVLDNNFTGRVSPSFRGLRDLREVQIGANNFGEDDDLSFMSSMTNCSQLSQLDIHWNSFTGPLPASISNLSTQLIGLYLSSNRFYGELPTGIGNLMGLQILNVEDNLLTGNIPPEIGMLPELISLSLGVNRLIGEIPPSICNGSNLITLFLGMNNLEGTIPSSLGNCNKLLELQLGKNKFNGSIPKELFTISSLSLLLGLSYNSLTGSLPSEVSHLKNLGIFAASNNNLTGEIPNSIGSCQSLESLFLQKNSFGGTIPPLLSNLKNLRNIDLSLNNLSGQIPEFLGNFMYLEYLNLSFNNFEGQIPNKGVFQNTSRVSLKGNKLLCGGPAVLHLNACSTKVPSKKRAKIFNILVPLISSSIFIFLLSSVWIYYWKTKLRKEGHSSPVSHSKYERISYQDLVKATNGFSSESLIGSGRYGSVYKGELGQEGTIVAVKVLNLQLRGATKTFDAECKALRNIKHRNLVKIVTSCSSIDYQGNDFRALVFEFIPNGSLETWLHKVNHTEQASEYLNVIQRLNVAIDVASALDYLHNQCQISIVHCDLKPSNILLDNDMVAHVADFGLAKFMNVVSSNFFQDGSSSLAIKGTIGYVPPEYGIGGVVSPRGDVYSYGIVLLEIFTGKSPTDEVSLNGLSIHEFVKHALPDQTMEIVDPQILHNIEVCGPEALAECLVSMLQVGLSCTTFSPQERPAVKDVLNEIHAIRASFLHKHEASTSIGHAMASA